MTSEPLWVSNTVWVVKDRCELASGRIIERKMFAELTAPDRIHVTALAHLWVASKAPWHAITDDLPQFAQGPTEHEHELASRMKTR
jgi:hypothetical protein